jgi:PPP family 3-phenylpropionic acid transporter
VSKNRRFLMLISVQFVFWALYASVSYIVVFLRERGFGATAIGGMLAINTVLAIVGQPLWGMLADKIGSVRRVFVFCLLASVPPFVVLPLLRAPLLVAVFLAISVILRAPLISLLDTWVVEEVRSDPRLDYGRIRAWGALSYSPIVLVYGWLADRISVSTVFPGYLLFAALTAVLFLKLTKEDPITVHTRRLRAGRLLRRPRYLAFVVFAATVQIPVSAVFNFLPIVVESVGGSTAYLGLIYFVRGISEIPAFLVTRKAARTRRYLLLIIAGASLYLLQLVLYTRVTGLAGLVAIQAVRGPAFALFLTGAVHYVRSIAPLELRATAQATARSLYEGAGGVIGNFGGGALIEHHGLPSLFRAGIILAGAGLCSFLLFITEQRASLVRRRKLARANRAGN